METHQVDEIFEAERILPSLLNACANRESAGNINLPDECREYLLPNFGKEYESSHCKEEYRENLLCAMSELAAGSHGNFQQLTGFSSRLSDVRMVIGPYREIYCQIFTKTLDWYESCVKLIDSPLDLLRLRMLLPHVDLSGSWFVPYRIVGYPELYITNDPAEVGSKFYLAQASCVLLGTAQHFEATAYLGNMASMIDSWQRYLCGAGNLSHAEAGDVARSIEARRAWLDFHSETVGEYVYDLNNGLEDMGIIPTIFPNASNTYGNIPIQKLGAIMLGEDSRFEHKVVTPESFCRVSQEIFQCPELADLFFRDDGRVITSPDRADEVAEKLRVFVAEKCLQQEFVLVSLSLPL